MKKNLSAIVIFAVIGSLTVAGLLAPDHLFSAREKRKLRQLPEFSVAGFLDRSWQEQAEEYVLDQFPGRNMWSELKKSLDWLEGIRETGGVYLASEGYLIDAFRSYPEEQFRENTRALAGFADDLEQSFGIPVHAILVPTAAHTLNHLLPTGAPTADQRAMTEFLRESGVPVVDVMKVLDAHRAEALYYRTDHHYTSLGAWYCYQAWQQARGVPTGDMDDWTKEILCRDFYGTTYAKASLPWIQADSIEAWYRNPNRPVTYNGAQQEPSIYHRQSLSGPEPYGVFLNSNQGLSVIEGGGRAGSLLIIKDSFGNTFAQFPVEEFSRVHLVDLRFFREDLRDYIGSNGITDVLFVYGLENFARDPFLPMLLP